MELRANIKVAFSKCGAALLCLVFSQILVVHSTEYFVSPSGSPSNSGTETSPWPSVGFAFSHATGGDVITLLPGTYGEEIIIELSGTAGNPTTIRSQRKWEAVIQGSPSHGIYIADGVTNVLIDGLQVAASAIDGVKVGSHATVRNCWIHNSARQGITAHRTQGVLLERNLIEHNGSHPIFDHGIYLSGTNNVVRCNVIRWNKCYGCQIYGDAPASSADCQFYNNLVYGNRNALTVWALAGQTNFVFNNTLSAGRYVLRANGGILCVSNNILLGPSARRIFSASSEAEFRADYNVISATGRRRGTHDVMVNHPGFVGANRGLFWPLADSPARGVATIGVLPPIDFFGGEQKQVLDVGAFQYRAELTADTRVLDPSPAKPDYWLTNVAATP
ncbi:MAG TPA: right-handed parallel beta-helix repeat-containing protein [Candidatus Paceibacterota bacterium]|nr:right-handed parallel beta-helix repeat-containing protein [Candidatus Paceibacterota bacterium]